MRRINTRQLGSICQRCAAAPAQAARQPFATRALRSPVLRATRAAFARPSGARWQSTSTELGADEIPKDGPATKLVAALDSKKNPAELAEAVSDIYNKFLVDVSEAPNSKATLDSLWACGQAASRLLPHLRKAEGQAKASASRLAQLGAERTGAGLDIAAEVKNASDEISQQAYKIITHPHVEMTPLVLKLYVHTQEFLGRPETLPSVLELYANKPKPVVKDGKVEFVPQNPNNSAKAVEKPVADMALQTAINAKNLDAALGITEVAFCTKAFKRNKLLKNGTTPAVALACLPLGIYSAATAYANYWQNTMDLTTATAIGVAGISGYFFVVGSLGMIAKLSAKDQMKRVTWLPGTPLRYRYMREEEREALDKIALAWGFKETWRHGEETGPEWEGLREYMGYRQMILDRVEFMEGMN